MLTIAESTRPQGRITVIVREHPPESLLCQDCSRSTGFHCGRSDHAPKAEAHRFHNLLTNVGKNAVREALFDSATDSIGIAFVAWGGSTTAPAVTDTTLVTELGRKAVTSQTLHASVGRIDTRMYLGPNEGVGDNIEEVGWFGGPSATATVDTGVLWSRILFSEAKTNLISIQFDREDTFA